MRAVVRGLLVLAMLAGTTFVTLPAAVAIEMPRTLADNKPVEAGPVEPGFPIDFVGVLWDSPGGDHEHAEGAETDGAVRFRHGATWTPWRPLHGDGADAAGRWASALVDGGDAEAYQVRGLPADAHEARAVAINTTDGPLETVAYRPPGAASALSNCLSRAEWGADESLRFDASGDEVWPPAFHDVQTMTVHHTATKNDDTDPAATVRAIYRYHAVDNGWGDIGYHYLIDEDGRVYEGRWSGSDEDGDGEREASTRCDGGGDGADFAHESVDPSARLVTAAHTGGFNSGNMGVALLGEFTTHPRFGAEPKAAAVDALEGLLAEFGSRHGLDPHAVVNYVNPVNGDAKTVDMISGHRDWTATECPGERLYSQLPAIRDAVAAKMGSVTVTITSPAAGAVVSGAISVTADATSDSGVIEVAFAVDGASIGTDTSAEDGWSADWDTTSASEGEHTVTATATDGTGDTATSSLPVTVDNDAATGLSVSSITPDSTGPGTTVDVTVSGTGFVSGAAVDLRNGDGPAPATSETAVADSTTITATITTKDGGPPRSSAWDVVVTNPDGATAVLDDGFTVLR